MSYLNFREVKLALRLSDEKQNTILQSFAAIKKIVDFTSSYYNCTGGILRERLYISLTFNEIVTKDIG